MKTYITKDGVTDAALMRAARDMYEALELAQTRILFIEGNYRIGIDRSCNSRMSEALTKARGGDRS
jgi:hypothetical protein